MDGLALLLTSFVIAFVLFLALRQLVLWYYRLNEIADNIAYIAEHYRRIDRDAGVRSTQDSARSGAGSPFTPMGKRA